MVIQTKYLGPTNTKGSRIKAKCDKFTLTIGYVGNHSHREAAKLLAIKYGWLVKNRLVSGEVDACNHAHVLERNDGAPELSYTIAIKRARETYKKLMEELNE